jgi:hypothetical protein
MVKIEDLCTECPVCRGAGFLQDPEWALWWTENDSVPPRGHRLFSVQEETPCEACGEIGYIPTEQGRALLEFLNRFRGVK